MKNMKKILSLGLAAIMTLGLTACGSDAGKTYTVGICQLVQHDALDAATKGFKDALTEKFGDKVTFDEQNAQNDTATCSTIINSFVSKNVDLILANATAPLQGGQRQPRQRFRSSEPPLPIMPLLLTSPTGQD